MFRNLLKDCWAQQPYNRPTFDNIDTMLQNILAKAETGDGKGIWPASENGAVLVKQGEYTKKENTGLFALSSISHISAHETIN